MGLSDLSDVMDNFRRIPTYVMVIMVFTIIQFLVVTLIGSFIALQMYRIAEAIQSSRPKNADTWTPQQQAYPPPNQPPAQYGPR